MSQTKDVLDYINQFGSISQLEAFRDLAIFRLGARCYDLKQLGYDITSTMETSTNRFGKRVSFARYSMAIKGQMELI